MHVTVDTVPLDEIPTFQVPDGSSPLKSVNVYVVLVVPHDLYATVPDGDVTINVNGERPLLTLQYTVTDVICRFVPRQLPEDKLTESTAPYKELSLRVIFEK